MSVNEDNNGASCRFVGRVSQVYVDAQDSIWQGQCSPSVTSLSYCCHWIWADIPNGCFLPIGQAIIILLPQLWDEWNCLWSDQLQAWHPDLTQGEYEEQCSDFGGSPTFNISQKRRVFKKILLTLGPGSPLRERELTGLPSVCLSRVQVHLFSATKSFFFWWERGRTFCLWWLGGL